MKKILFFDKLDYFTLVVAILFRPFFNQVVFRSTITFFQNSKTHKYLNFFGLRWISFYKLNYKVFNNTHKLRPFLEKKYIENQVSNSYLVRKFINEFKLNERQIEKLYLCFRDEFYKKEGGNSETFSITLIDNFFPENYYRVYFIPYHPLTYLLIKELNKKNIVIIGFHVLIQLFFDLIKKLKRLFAVLFKKILFIKSNKIKSKNLNKIDISSCSIGFFPHKNLKYSQFFKKTYLYENDSESYFFKQKVLTLFEEETDELSKRYFNRYTIPYANIYTLISKRILIYEIYKLLLSLISLKTISNLRSLRKILFFYTFIKFRYKFIFFLNILGQLRSLRVIYVHYDTLFPLSFILACDLKNITTVSSQERTNQYIFFSPSFYNKYLTTGEEFNKILEDKGYICDHFHNIGLPRSEYIKNISKFSIRKLHKYLEMKKSKKIVLCFGLNPTSSYVSSCEGDNGTSLTSVIYFLKSMIDLAKHFRQLYFVIRFKTMSAVDEMPNELISEVKKTGNIEIQNDFNKVNSYELASISDLIIGKQTLIMEEALSAGKKIIFYDNENYMSSLDCPIYKLNNLVKNDFDGLKNRIKEIVDEKYDTSQEIENLTNKYYRSQSGRNGFDLIKDIIEQSL